MIRENVLYSPEFIGSNDTRVYVISLILRNKDFPDGFELPFTIPNAHEKFIRHWIVQNDDELIKHFPSMKAWADLFHGRLYLGVDAKDMTKIVSSQVHDEIELLSNTYPTARQRTQDLCAHFMKSTHSFPRREDVSVPYLRRLLIDVDITDSTVDLDICVGELHERLEKEKTNPFITIPSKTGAHLVSLIRSPYVVTDTRRIDEILKEFHAGHPTVEVECKRNSMVNLYMNVLQ